ncbi:hypothetical protein C882_3176 [Caenispirillum salinarum AK4]|uniref:Uncharacterized protein n=1 Tax=Caenispirillum salinarum AK4 TaxID=1238182 RepID=K9H3J2_9PROT|nr:hypothetical protein C882_3176 [Caenispirillum salinarum AK4]
MNGIGGARQAAPAPRAKGCAVSPNRRLPQHLFRYRGDFFTAITTS